MTLFKEMGLDTHTDILNDVSIKLSLVSGLIGRNNLQRTR